MKFISETSEKKQHALIVSDKPTLITNLLQTELKKFNTEIYLATRPPLVIEKFDYIFFINEGQSLKKIDFSPKQKVVFIFLKQQSAAQSALKTVEKRQLDIKIISCLTDLLSSQDLEKILWFSFSRSNESFLTIGRLTKNLRKQKIISSQRVRNPKFSRKTIIIIFILLLLFANLLMIPFLALSSYLYYKAGLLAKNNQIKQVEPLLIYADKSLAVSKILYRPVRPVYAFFSLALFPDSLFNIDQKTRSLLHHFITMSENTNQIFQAILQKNKTPEDIRLLEMRFTRMKSDLSSLQDDLASLAQALPNSPGKIGKLKPQLADASLMLGKAQKILPHLDNLLAKNTQKKYLLLFANNMELRPGGGFIGSFGILTMKNMTLDSIKVYDVYDADGQLKIHIDPPEPVRKYLQQPHWFFRDSAFSSDFFENYNEAKFFLNQELGMTDFAGGVLLTTTSIQNILQAYGNIYLPNYNENVNKDNFYIKAQLYSEQNFFPGSTQKKNFLGDLAKQILLNLDQVSAPILLQQLERSLNEKQIVMIVEDSAIQKVIDSLYWAGKTITPRCAEEQNSCILDYAFPVEANLGVNKANFFIRHNFTQKITFDKQGIIRNSLLIKIQNDSVNDVFPGGTYKNYFQIFLPLGSQVTSLTRDGTIVDNLDQRETEFKILGFYFELSPQKSTEIQIDYRLPQEIIKGTNIYQLVMQKQTGSSNSDLELEISLPENISLVRQNFSPLVKDNRIFYNTSLNADKIFLLQLNRK